MPFPKLSKLLRPKTDGSSLREQAAGLQDRLARGARPAPQAAVPVTAAPTSEPAPLAAASHEDPPADAELLRLGRRFQDAAAREVEACAAINAAAAEAERHEPAFPACLTLTAADHELSVYQHWTHPEALEGITLGGADVDWLRRKMPMTHEVLRPIREGERAHIDHPGRRFDIVPHPEAQARAEEIVAAYDAWRADLRRVYDEYVPAELETAADAAGEVATTLAGEIAALPARTAAGLCVKLRALLHYESNALVAELPELPDPDQILSHSLRRDVERAHGVEPHAVDWHDPPPGFMASPAIEPTHFARVKDGIRIEAGRLLGIAVAELQRRRAARIEGHGKPWDADDAARINKALHLDALASIACPEHVEITGWRYVPEAEHMVAAPEEATAPGPDPIFAVIAASRQAEAEMKAFGEDPNSASRPGWQKREDALAEAQDKTRIAVWGTVPTTQAGRLALIDYAYFHISLYGADLAPGTDSGVVIHEILKAFKAAVAAERPGAEQSPLERPNLSPDRAWAVAQAAAVDLSGLTVLQLCNLFGCFAETADRWLDIMHSGWASNDSPSGFLDPNAAGDLASREHERAAEIRTRIAGEIERRATADHWERDQRLEVLIRYELMCNGSLEHAPDLRAEMARAWGA